jgi:hypothetical protein
LQTGWGAVGVDDAIAGQVEGGDGVFFRGGDGPGGAAAYGHLPDLPRVARLLFGGEKHAVAVKGDRGIGGGCEAGCKRPVAAAGDQLEGGSGGKALAALQGGGGVVAPRFGINVRDGDQNLAPERVAGNRQDYPAGSAE